MQAEQMKNIIPIPMAKLAWACRRGMLELDILLGNFLKNKYLDLSNTEQQLFANLLSHPDPTLLAWLMGHEMPEDETLIAIVKLIREHARIHV